MARVKLGIDAKISELRLKNQLHRTRVKPLVADIEKSPDKYIWSMAGVSFGCGVFAPKIYRARHHVAGMGFGAGRLLIGLL